MTRGQVLALVVSVVGTDLAVVLGVLWFTAVMLGLPTDLALTVANLVAGGVTLAVFRRKLANG